MEGLKDEMEKYVRVVYQSEPIGKERIILYLTTFDKEAFERDNLFQLKEEKIIHEFESTELNRPDFIEMFERNLNIMVKNIYEEKLKEIESIIKISKNVMCIAILFMEIYLIVIIFIVMK